MMHTRIKKTGEKIRDGYAVSRCKENMNISIISSIIHDGVESMDELIRKYHSMQQQMTLEETEEYIYGLQEKGLVGYYTTALTGFGEPALIFVVWEPEKHTFEKCQRIQRLGEAYYRPMFQKRRKKEVAI
jgi:hypothetical protein